MSKITEAYAKYIRERTGYDAYIGTAGLIYIKFANGLTIKIDDFEVPYTGMLTMYPTLDSIQYRISIADPDSFEQLVGKLEECIVKAKATMALWPD